MLKMLLDVLQKKFVFNLCSNSKSKKGESCLMPLMRWTASSAEQ